MQRVVLTRQLLNELNRCDKAFIMSMFHHNLDNEHLSDHSGYGMSCSEDIVMQKGLLKDQENVKRIADTTGGIKPIRVSTSDMWEKVRETEKYLGSPCVISDGALESNNMIIGFSLLVVREDGKWDVYHTSTKCFYNKAHNTDQKVLETALRDAGPLLKVLAEKYSDKVANLWVTGIDGRYNTPYPDPETGAIKYDGESAICRIRFDLDDPRFKQYVDDFDPTPKINQLLEQVSRDPEWIPDCRMGSQCNTSEKYGNYDCPFKTFCQQQLPMNHVQFHLPYNDRKKCIDHGIETMDELVEISYDFPTLEGIEIDDKPFTLSEIALREMREYEISVLRK